MIIETARRNAEQVNIIAPFEIEASKINENLLKISFAKENDGSKIDITFHPGIKKEVTINTTNNEGSVEIKIE